MHGECEFIVSLVRRRGDASLSGSIIVCVVKKRRSSRLFIAHEWGLLGHLICAVFIVCFWRFLGGFVFSVLAFWRRLLSSESGVRLGGFE